MGVRKTLIEFKMKNKFYFSFFYIVFLFLSFQWKRENLSLLTFISEREIQVIAKKANPITGAYRCAILLIALATVRWLRAFVIELFFLIIVILIMRKVRHIVVSHLESLLSLWILLILVHLHPRMSNTSKWVGSLMLNSWVL